MTTASRDSDELSSSSYARNAVLVFGKAFISGADLAAQFAPVPWMSTATSALGAIIELCENVKSNRHAARQLAERCYLFLQALRDSTQSLTPGKLQEANDQAVGIFQSIQDKMTVWASLNRVRAFVMQQEIAKDIEACHGQISDCCAIFQITSSMEIYHWQNKFKAKTQEDHDEMMEALAVIDTRTSVICDAVLETNKLLQQSLMQTMQKGLGDFEQGDMRHHGLQRNLHQLQKSSHQLLPELELKRGEVRRVGSFPSGGSSAMDIWEGRYLDNEKVAIKVVRAVNADPKSLKRFKREIQLWNRVWREDGGQHILPFYGFCQTDGPFPYMVSPWQEGGIAIDYVKKYGDQVDHRELIKGIAEGLYVLHKMTPPVVHGDMKGANVVISNMGTPLIADFGVSKVVEDITGIPFTQSRGVSESYRWFAPELCIGQGILSLEADIYAFGMTILELMTHVQPFSHVKHTTEVVVRVSAGERPRQPTDPVVTERGLDAKLWALMEKCWLKERNDRPSIDTVLQELS